MKASEFDDKFDKGEDLNADIDTGLKPQGQA